VVSQLQYKIRHKTSTVVAIDAEAVFSVMGYSRSLYIACRDDSGSAVDHQNVDCRRLRWFPPDNAECNAVRPLTKSLALYHSDELIETAIYLTFYLNR